MVASIRSVNDYGIFKGGTVSKFLIKLLFALSLVFTAPVIAEASISLQDQRTEVIAALDDVITGIDAEIASAQAALTGLDPFSLQARVLNRQILILQGRKNFILSIQAAVPSFSQATLDTIILRFDLAVSLS